MKLGVYFNVFSGVELLKPALLNIRPFADYIVGVYSLISNTGMPIAPFVLPLLRSLQKEGLFDKLICFKLKPSKIPVMMANNNGQKYRLGRLACLKQGCTHLMLRDCDEFYDSKQFESMLPVFEKEDLVIAPIFEYIKSPLRRAKKISGLYISVSHKAKFEYKGMRYPVKLDRARTVGPVRKFKLLTKEELILHHFTYVRYNERELRRKFEGHGNFIRNTNNNIELYRKRIEAMNENLFMDIEDQFGILSYWRNEFDKLYRNTM